MTTTRLHPRSPARLLGALVQRDFAAMTALLAPDARLRALIPPGPIEADGAAAVAAQFDHWFGAARDFTVLGRSMTPIGDRFHTHWRVERRDDDTGRTLTAEQHAFVTVGEAGVTAIDLVCSGWLDTGR